MTKIRNILIAPDNFGGSLSAEAAADALETAVRRQLIGGGQARVEKRTADSPETELEAGIAAADFILTGEACFGNRDIEGTFVGKILAISRKYKKKPVIVCGRNHLPHAAWKKAGITDIYTLSEAEADPERCRQEAAAILSGSRTLVAGCDEAGRGCLAGPVFAAAVILPEGFSHPLLNDSKQLSEAQRDELRPVIEREALAWAVVAVDAEEIDRINILNASIEGMKRALDQLSVRPGLVLADGNRFSPWRDIPSHTVVKGDGTVQAIAAASVLAKTHRDEYMRALAREYPQYGWDRNMAYPTEAHRKAIRQYGITPYHRKSYRLLDDDDALLFGRSAPEE